MLWVGYTRWPDQLHLKWRVGACSGIGFDRVSKTSMVETLTPFCLAFRLGSGLAAQCIPITRQRENERQRETPERARELLKGSWDLVTRVITKN